MKTPEIHTKLIKHVFTLEERAELGSELSRAFRTLTNIEAEADEIKASIKSRLTRAQAEIGSLTTDIGNGFSMISTRCEVVYFPAERVKRFYMVGLSGTGASHIAEDAMTPEDFEQDLIRAESKFECRKEITIFNVPVAKSSAFDIGTLTLGRFDNHWFSALKIKIGRNVLEERLDSEQPSCKKRSDALSKAAKRLKEWLTTALGKDTAKGFEGPIATALEPERELEE